MQDNITNVFGAKFMNTLVPFKIEDNEEEEEEEAAAEEKEGWGKCGGGGELRGAEQ